VSAITAFGIGLTLRTHPISATKAKDRERIR
jgi:hypothetical protein